MSRTYEVVVAPSAERELRKLERPIQALVFRTLDDLSRDPLPRGVKKLHGGPYFRIRAGRDHRIVYTIHEGRLVVVLVIRDRKDAYRGPDALGEKLRAALSRDPGEGDDT